MKFAIDPDSFIRMLQMLTQAHSLSSRKRHLLIRLSASRDRLRVQHDHFAAETEAIVWGEGSCSVSASRLLQALVDAHQLPRLVIEIQDEQLRVGEALIPCISDSTARWVPSSSLFFASELGVVSSDAVPALTPVAA